jgi:hypothetical protein
VLKSHSPVFRTMLESDFKEKDASYLVLEGKKYKDFIQFLQTFYPNKAQKITGNVCVLVNACYYATCFYIRCLCHSFSLGCTMFRHHDDSALDALLRRSDNFKNKRCRKIQNSMIQHVIDSCKGTTCHR